MASLRLFVLPLLATFALNAAGEVLLAAQSPGSERRRPARPSGIGLEIHELAGYQPSLGTTADLEPFREIVGDASVVALGESWHMSGGFYLMKHRLLRYLVQEKGFRAFAVESNWESVERTNAYVQTCTGTAESAIREEHIVWQSKEYADMVRWMCEWNRAHPAPADRLTMFGFDIQQPERDGPALDSLLGQFGIPQSDPRRSGLRSCEKAFGLTHPFGEIPPAVHATCMTAVEGVELFLEANRTTIVQQTSEEAFAIAMLRVIGLRANQEQIFEIRDDFAKGFNYRDEAMAYAFHLRRAMKAPAARTVLWAADVHIAQNILPNGERPMGSYLETDLGPDYVTVAITAYQTEVPQTAGVCRFTARAPGSVEEQLATYGHQTLLARPRGGARQDQVLPMGFFTFRPFVDFDGIIFLAHSPSMQPLLYQGCR
jgi:erythromycin esterase